MYFYDGQWGHCESFYAWGKFVDNKLVNKVYRYPSANLGPVTVKDDFTAVYCGNYKWRFC